MDVDFMLAVKRAFDVLVAATCLLLLSPLLVFIAMLVKLNSKGPVFYRWRIVGAKSRNTTSYKFRTMVKDAEFTEEALRRNGANEMKGVYFKLKDDHRVTSVGKILRKYSIDEIPSLYSVLKGDVSLVGPRPVRLHEYERLKDRHKGRFAMRPGVTSLWVVRGKNKIDDFDDIAALDGEYIEHWSLLLDLKILLRTVPIVILGQNY